MIKRILYIGIPSGIENGMFQFGKLAIQSSVSTLGTTAIAAQAMTIIFESINGIAAIAVGMGLMTVVGQTLGAGRREEAKYYIVKHMRIGDYIIILSCLLTFLFCKPVMFLAGMEQESARICFNMMIYITIVKCLVWVPSFITPYGLRAAGDVKYSMIVSSLSMWLSRVALSTILIRFFGFGPIAVWYGMSLDWLVRGLFYLHRFMGNKWLSHSFL
jgi:Na+-driven multidrug efflux pump